MIRRIALTLGLLGCAPDAPPAPPTPPSEEAKEEGHSHAEHMVQMAATRERLRVELGEAYEQPVPGLGEASGDNGKAAYDANCASCHGPAGKGDGPAGAGLMPPPADFTDAFHARYYSDAGRVQIIRKGSPGTAMASFEGALSDEQVRDVYAFVRTFRGDAAAEGSEHVHEDGTTHTH